MDREWRTGELRCWLRMRGANFFGSAERLLHRTRQLLDAAFPLDVHEIDLRFVKKEMVVQSRDGEALLQGNAQHRIHLILKEDQSPAAPGEVGELWVRGPSLMKGYWGLPERTAEVLVRRMAPPAMIEENRASSSAN